MAVLYSYTSIKLLNENLTVAVLLFEEEFLNLVSFLTIL